MQDAKNRQKVAIWAPSHNFVGPYLRKEGTYRQSDKNLLSSNMSPQYGERRPTSGWDRSGSLMHPCKFQPVSRLCSVTARRLVVGVSQTLRRWTDGATYVRQGDHHVGHWLAFCYGVDWFTDDRRIKSSIWHFNVGKMCLKAACLYRFAVACGMRVYCSVEWWRLA